MYENGRYFYDWEENVKQARINNTKTEGILFQT
jgi:hypothetical protein